MKLKKVNEMKTLLIRCSIAGAVIAVGAMANPVAEYPYVDTIKAQEVITENEGDVIENPWKDSFNEETSVGDVRFDGENATSKKATEQQKKQNAEKERKTLIKTTVKVKTAVKKKKEKKIKITLAKKVAIANGYEVRVYTKKSLAKKNKKPILKKTVKKNKKTFYVSGKKIKGIKKLYVRVRAYKIVNGKKYRTKTWSKAKKVKIK